VESGTLREPGAPLVMSLTAEAQGEEAGARIQAAEPLDAAAEKVQKGLRVFLRSVEPLDAVDKRLEPVPGRASKADGEVNMVLMLAGGAGGEGRLPGRVKGSPQIARGLKAVAGRPPGQGGLIRPRGPGGPPP